MRGNAYLIRLSVGLVTEYPAWFILFCILLGAGYATALYFRSKPEIPQWLYWLLYAFRFLSVFLISFLLLSPLIRQKIRTVEKPVIIIGTDHSQSLVAVKDSALMRDTLPAMLDAFAKKLGKKFEVRTFSFGGRVREGYDPSFSDPVTDISAFLHETEKRFAGRNVGALILVSDGIYNQGLNPVYSSRKLSWPLYSVVLGDTVQKKDLLVKKAVFNRQVFLGDRFPVEISVEAMKCNGAQATLTVMKGGQVAASVPFAISGNRFLRKITLELEAKEKGIQRYSVILSPVSDEFTLLNNRREVVVEVLDERQQVAILYDAPHPDVSAIRQALEAGIRYEVTESKYSAFNRQPEEFDLIILYQIPSSISVASPDRFLKAKTALLFILGTNTDFNAFNGLKTGLTILAQKSSFTESQPALNKAFPNFTIPEETENILSGYPPLLCPFGTYQSSPLSDVFLYQRVGSVNTQFPMIIFFKNEDRKTGVITGENIWRWRLGNFVRKGDHGIFDELIGKVVTYLSVKGDRSFFRVVSRTSFSENEPVEFSAEVLNESYELINDPDVNLTVKDAEGESYPFVMTKTGRDYYLNAGNFPSGQYTWEASVNVGKNRYTRTGMFIVSPVSLESLSLAADHALMAQLAAEHDGRALTPSGLDRLADELLSRRDISSVSHSSKRFSNLTGNVWLFILITALLAVEWVIRKRSGI